MNDQEPVLVSGDAEPMNLNISLSRPVGVAGAPPPSRIMRIFRFIGRAAFLQLLRVIGNPDSAFRKSIQQN